MSPRGIGLDRLPVIGRVQRADLVHIDQAGVLLGAKADALAGIGIAFQVDGQRQAVIDVGLAIHQRRLLMQPAQRVSLKLGEPWRMRSWLRREPLRTSTGKVWGQISA